jgi:hypothetical protein
MVAEEGGKREYVDSEIEDGKVWAVDINRYVASGCGCEGEGSHSIHVDRDIKLDQALELKDSEFSLLEQEQRALRPNLVTRRGQAERCLHCVALVGIGQQVVVDLVPDFCSNKISAYHSTYLSLVTYHRVGPGDTWASREFEPLDFSRASPFRLGESWTWSNCYIN